MVFDDSRGGDSGSSDSGGGDSGSSDGGDSGGSGGDNLCFDLIFAHECPKVYIISDPALISLKLSWW